MIDVRRLKWISAVKECRIHISRLHAAFLHIAVNMPLDAGKIEHLSDEETAWLDQFLYRFSKLQDAVGDRIFIEGLFLLGEEYLDKPFIDALNRLEGLNIIPSCAWWMELREYRNQIAHEYPDRKDEQAVAVNEIYVRCEEFVQVVEAFIGTVDERK